MDVVLFGPGEILKRRSVRLLRYCANVDLNHALYDQRSACIAEREHLPDQRQSRQFFQRPGAVSRTDQYVRVADGFEAAPDRTSKT